MTETPCACGAQTRNAVFSPMGIAPIPTGLAPASAIGYPPSIARNPRAGEPVP